MMLNDLIFSWNIFSPEDAATMKSATALAIVRAGTLRPLSELDEQAIAQYVIGFVRKGYTRAIDGTLDMTSLAESAVVRFQANSERIVLTEPHSGNQL